jgi:hypothetical protein
MRDVNVGDLLNYAGEGKLTVKTFADGRVLWLITVIARGVIPG